MNGLKSVSDICKGLISKQMRSKVYIINLGFFFFLIFFIILQEEFTQALDSRDNKQTCNSTLETIIFLLQSIIINMTMENLMKNPLPSKIIC